MNRFLFAASMCGAAGLGCMAEEAAPGADTPLQLETIEGTVEAGDAFGNAVVVGDFDGDGADDLAVASSEESPGSAGKVGSVIIYMGSKTNGLVPTLRLDGTVNAAHASGDQFGYALAAIKRAGRGCSDLIVGAPGGAPDSHTPRGGVVYVFPCNVHTGLDTIPGMITQATPNANGTAGGVVSAGDRFGASLAVATTSSQNWLAVGSPGEKTSGQGTGFAFAYTLSAAGRPVPTLFDKVGNPHGTIDDNFGHAVAIGDLDGDGRPDLAVATYNGADWPLGGSHPNLDFPNDEQDSNDGTVYAYKNTSSGFTSQREFDDPLPQVEPSHNRFGYALAIGPIESTSGAPTNNRLVVGIPGVGMSSSCNVNAGALEVYESSASWTWVRSSPITALTAGVSTCNGFRMGYAITIAKLADPNGLSHIIATGPGTDGLVFQFGHNTSGWFGGTGIWVNGVETGGGLVTADEVQWVSIAAGDFRKTGHLDIAAGAPFFDGNNGNDLFSGAFTTLFNTGSDTWINGQFFDEGSN